MKWHGLVKPLINLWKAKLTEFESILFPFENSFIMDSVDWL